MYRLLLLGILPAVAGVSGCIDAASIEMQQGVIQEADPDQVLAAATAILQREFGRVRVDRSARRISTAPVEYTTQRESGTARDLYRGRSTMRKVAQFNVGRTGGQTVARIRVDIERRDTERQALMRPRAHRLSDNPGEETPIEADAATTSEQNTVWTRVRRDRTLERAVLDELREQFARLTAEPEGAERPTQAASNPASGARP